MTENLSLPAPDIAVAGGDNLRVRRWFALFAAYFAALAIPSAAMLSGLDRPWQDLFTHAEQFTETYHQLLKLLVFTAYLSLCCTFCPMPTGWLVAAIATREVALAPSMIGTVALVATAGAVGSTMANLNDYHLFTLLLRSRRIAAVRRTRAYRAAARWFDKAPFTILVIFNIIPIPVDIARMLAATRRYDRSAFAAANFLGRSVRYGVLAGVAYATGLSALAATVIMLAIGAALALGRAIVRV